MISKLLGFDSDYIIIGLAAVVLIMFIIMIINMVQLFKLKKRYKIFMSGKNARNLEKTLIEVGLVKYDAFNEMGGKLSFSLALLNEKNDGFVMNAVHSREGCYTYVKEIIDGNSIIVLSPEEQEALDMAKESNK